jgi:putative pyrroloquinoline-quinone binding quinoprotein
MWTRQLVVRSPRPSGLARRGLRVTACWRQASPRLAWGILPFLASLCLVGGASGAGGDLVWEDQVDKAGGADGVNALAIRKGQVFAAGSDTNAAGNRDFLVRAYRANTGVLLWADQVDQAGDADRAFALAVGAGQVFAAGFGTNTAGNQDFLVRAYDPKSGALLWEDQLDRAGFNDVAEALAVQGRQVFAAGSSEPGAGNQDFLVRAYDAKSGAVLWEDQADTAGRNDVAFALAVRAGQVFAAGFGTNAAGNQDFLLRAYQAKDGALLWEDQVDQAGFDETAFALAVGEGQVFAAGSGQRAAGNEDFLVRAYDAKSGALLWEDQVDPAGGFDGANALALARGRLFAAGFVTNAAGHFDVLIRAYEAKTGALLWADQVDHAGFDDAALALTVQGGQVFIAGFGTKAAGNNDFLVRAYQAKSGALVWEDLVDRAGLSEAAVALAAGGGQVVAGGVGTNAAGNFDVLIRAYDVK